MHRDKEGELVGKADRGGKSIQDQKKEMLVEKKKQEKKVE